MKNRYNAPFGYAVIKGITEIHPEEAAVVRKLFADYIAGASLKSIAENLTERKIEFLPGRSDWNKNRVKRILEDARYTGSTGLPAIIDEADFTRAGVIKNERNNHADQQSPRLPLPVVCADCETKIQRRHEHRSKRPERWYCPGCGAVTGLRQGELEDCITEILNRLIAQPDLVTDEPPAEEQPLNIVSMQNEISRLLEGFHFDRDTVKSSIFELAVLKYSRLDNRKNMTKQLRAELTQMAPLSAFSPEVLIKIAGQICLSAPDIVQLQLKNGQIIGKDDGHEGDNDPRETGVHTATDEPPAQRGGLCAGEHICG